MYLSACIEWIFADGHPDIVDRVAAAKAAGLGGVEFHLWREKPMERIAAAVRDVGIEVTSLVVDPRCHLCNAAAREDIVRAVAGSVPAARRVGSRALVVASGPMLPGVDDAGHAAAMVANLKAAAPIVEDAGLALLVEPLNTRVEHPGMFLDSTTRGLDIIAEVSSPAVKLLYDLYHSSTMGEWAGDVLKGRMGLVGHVQVADSPGRGEPGTGSIDWPRAMAELRSLGYDGALGLEFKPRAASLEALARTRSLLGL